MTSPFRPSFAITLVIGDWSTDGHGRVERVHIVTNRTESGLRLAYKKGATIVGLDLTAEVAHEYEDSTLRVDALRKLVEAGYPITRLDDEEGNEIFADSEYLSPEEFAEIWLFIARKGDPDLEVEIVQEGPRINIGGYGLFSS